MYPLYHKLLRFRSINKQIQECSPSSYGECNRATLVVNKRVWTMWWGRKGDQTDEQSLTLKIDRKHALLQGGKRGTRQRLVGELGHDKALI